MIQEILKFEPVSWNEVLNNNKKLDFILNPYQMRGLLEEIGYSTDNEFYIINKNTGKRVLTPEEQEIKINELGFVFPGPEGSVFVKNDIVSYAFYLSKSKEWENGSN